MQLLHRTPQHEADDHYDHTTDEVRAARTSTDDADRTMVHEGSPVVHRTEHGEVQQRRAPTTVRERTWTFAPGQIVSFGVGIGLLAVGTVVLLRAGVDGSLATPTVHVLTYSHTAWLGFAEIGLGMLLVLAGTGARGRPISVLLGAATVVAGLLVLTQPAEMPDELGLEKAFGWPLIALGAVVAMAAMALPVWRRRKILDTDVLQQSGDHYEERRGPF